MKKNKKIIIIAIIIFSIINLLCVKIPWLRKELLFQNIPKYYTGDLFEINKVLNFKNKIYKVKEKEEDNTLENSTIITMGDSFFTANYESAIFPELLEEHYNNKVYNVPREDLKKVDDNPLKYLQKQGYKKGDKKYLVLETVERYSIERCVEYVTPFELNTNTAATQTLRVGERIKNFLPKTSVNVFFHNSVLLFPIEQLSNTFKFNVFKDIDRQTPVYTKDYSQVFYHEELGFAKRIKDDDTINIIANNITYLRDSLRDLYNIELIYMIVPDKYSIYGEGTYDPITYDNYIPRLTKVLEKKGINTFDLYTQYKKISKDTLLYYKGDSHFTPAAKNILLEHCVRYLPKDINQNTKK